MIRGGGWGFGFEGGELRKGGCLKEEGGLKEGGGVGGGNCWQHGPVQDFKFLLWLDVLKGEHLTWSQFRQLVHCTAVAVRTLVHIIQCQT